MTGLGEGHADSQEGASKLLLAATRCWFPISLFGPLSWYVKTHLKAHHVDRGLRGYPCYPQIADSSQQSCKASADSELLESAEDLLQARYRRFVNLVGAKRCQKDGTYYQNDDMMIRYDDRFHFAVSFACPSWSWSDKTPLFGGSLRIQDGSFSKIQGGRRFDLTMNTWHIFTRDESDWAVNPLWTVNFSLG